jgi:succinoglycan biosynthesis protein ExoM
MQITILTPTFKRPNGIVRAARSVFAQTAGRSDVEFVSVDNDPAGSGMAALAMLKAESPIPFSFAHAPEPGVSNARNAAMALSRGALIAFLDDDQEAEPGWLDALIACQARTRADTVFGLTNARLETPNHPHADYIASLYQRSGPSQSSLIKHFYGINNSLLVRATMLAQAAPFDLRANECGGEDDLLFQKGLREGRSYAWCIEARAIEWVEPRRAKISFALKRALAYGQGPCETAWNGTPRDYLGLARHMAIGAGQACAYGAAAAVAFAARLPMRMQLLDRSVRGLGKVVWWKTQRFYGAAHRP